MKERPILFSAPMVRALLAGTKTQTRRALKMQPVLATPVEGVHEWRFAWPNGQVGTYGCPYGVPGDVLWVRETMRVDPARETLIYLADQVAVPKGSFAWPSWFYQYGERSIPSIHMPRWASRISLRITDVRVERLNEISEADALAEGIERLRYPEVGDWGWPQARYRQIWEAINGPGSWDANPWVWAVSFERI